MAESKENVIMLPRGVELNQGLNEDSDSVTTVQPTKIRQIGEIFNGAMPVHLVGEDGSESDEIFFWHQPENNSTK